MMGLTWFCLGVLTFIAAILLWKGSQRYRLNWMAWTGLLLGVFLVLFSIAWAMGSVLEGVPRAASMGLLCFGLGGVALLALTMKFAGVKPVSIPAPKEVKPHAPTSANVEVPGIVSRAVRPLAYLTLAVAFIVGLTGPGKDFESLVLERFPGEKLTKVNDAPMVFQIGDEGEGPGNFVMIQEGQGYGGPFVLGIRIMDDGKVHEVFPLDHKETPSFAKRIDEAKYGEQFIGKGVGDDFIVGVDVDAVSGATVTTMAVTQAVRGGAHLAAERYFKLKPEWQKVPWKIGLEELLILTLFILAFFPKIYAQKPWRYVYLAATVAITGFYLNASISISNLGALAMGFIPGVKDHLTWWILTVGTLLAAAFLGKNVYCYRICPFHGIQFLLNKISGSRLTLTPGLAKRTRFIANFLVWLSLMTIFLSTHPAWGAYEPFAMMFSLQGIGLQWYILPIALLGAFFLNNYWCRFFCPLGHAFTNLLQIRRHLLGMAGLGKKPVKEDA